MATTLPNFCKKFMQIVFVFTPDAEKSKTKLLEDSKHVKLQTNNWLTIFHDLVLFICAYPQNINQYTLAKSTLRKIEKFLAAQKNNPLPKLENSGLLNTHAYKRFTHDFTNWLHQHPQCTISIFGYDEYHKPYNEILKCTLNTVEQEICSSGADDDELLDLLGVHPNNKLSFLLEQFSTISNPYIKDDLWEQQGMITDLVFSNAAFTRTKNKLAVSPIYFQKDIIKKFDVEALLHLPIPEPKHLSENTRLHLADTIKSNLALHMRETDPVTYMNIESLQLYDLERGIQIALFGLLPERQLPWYSYIGYTLFKNGYPASYGGAWVAGNTANFGINIFEPYRGGESGYKMIQLLRLYKQIYGINYFEIEPYQFGLDNPDGIKSGAFWFYYRFGFRPVNLALRKLADNEAKKIAKDKSYRTSEKTLIRFTESNLALQLGSTSALALQHIQSDFSTYIKRFAKGSRTKAFEIAVTYATSLGWHCESNNAIEVELYKQLALLATIYKLNTNKAISCLKEMHYWKSRNAQKYNDNLRIIIAFIE